MNRHEQLKWWLIRHWPWGYRLASQIELQLFNRDYLQELARGCKLFGQLIHQGDLCFDIGANHGSRSEVFLRLGARVVAVEPQPRCVERLSARFGHRSEFHLVAKALGAENGSATLHLGRNDLISTLSEEWLKNAKRIPELSEIGWQGTLDVPITTLEDLIERFGLPDFCKIDVEGYELQVLEGTRQALPLLSVEYQLARIEPTVECIDRLMSLGQYRFNLSELESMRFSFEDWLTREQITQQLEERFRKDQFGYGDVYARLLA